MSNTIIDIHQKCLDFLLDYQIKTPDFYFIPRKIDKKKRLSKKMYFRGNDNYLVLSFWDSADSKEQIYHISFQIDANGDASIELSCRDDDAKLPYIIAIKEIIEKNGKTFQPLGNKKNRWRYCYSKDTDYIDALSDFILNEKAKIDKYVLANPDCKIPVADKQIDDKFVKTLPIYQVYKEAISKIKNTEAVMVKASEYYMKFEHNKLSNELYAYLNNNGYSSVVTDEDFVDIKAIDCNGNKLFFELKTATKVKSAIRQALGQLLEYQLYPKNSKTDSLIADKLIIVTEYEASTDDIKYLKTLRENYNLPIYYQQFDIDKKVLNDEV